MMDILPPVQNINPEYLVHYITNTAIVGWLKDNIQNGILFIFLVSYTNRLSKVCTSLLTNIEKYIIDSSYLYKFYCFISTIFLYLCQSIKNVFKLNSKSKSPCEEEFSVCKINTNEQVSKMSVIQRFLRKTNLILNISLTPEIMTSFDNFIRSKTSYENDMEMLMDFKSTKSIEQIYKYNDICFDIDTATVCKILDEIEVKKIKNEVTNYDVKKGEYTIDEKIINETSEFLKSINIPDLVELIKMIHATLLDPIVEYKKKKLIEAQLGLTGKSESKKEYDERMKIEELEKAIDTLKNFNDYIKKENIPQLLFVEAFLKDNVFKISDDDFLYFIIFITIVHMKLEDGYISNCGRITSDGEMYFDKLYLRIGSKPICFISGNEAQQINHIAIKKPLISPITLSKEILINFLNEEKKWSVKNFESFGFKDLFNTAWFETQPVGTKLSSIIPKSMSSVSKYKSIYTEDKLEIEYTDSCKIFDPLFNELKNIMKNKDITFFVDNIQKNYIKRQEEVDEKHKDNKAKRISFLISTYKECKLTELCNEFLSFFQKAVLIESESKSNEVKIFEIKCLKHDEIKLIDNPEYVAYLENEEKKEVKDEKNESDLTSGVDGLEELEGDDFGAGIGNGMGMGMMGMGMGMGVSKFRHRQKMIKKQPPPQKINKLEITYEIQCTEVGNTRKDIDTLYLRKNDMHKLQNILNIFKHHKEMYQNLCIPRKLGFMFYGVPGTGKTTTIRTVATYLGKDIYYVNLNNVRKNSQLKEIFDKVSGNYSKGGIIVFEDIDAMTTIVHNRISSISDSSIDGLETSKSLTGVLDETDDSLSLSYFLNLLDGTLCSNENIFVLTTNHKEHLDPAIYRAGRIDLQIDFKRCDHFQIQKIFKSFIGRELDDKVLEKITEDKYTPAEIITDLMSYVYNKEEQDEIMLKDFIC